MMSEIEHGLEVLFELRLLLWWQWLVVLANGLVEHGVDGVKYGHPVEEVSLGVEVDAEEVL
jgi:hypothetical protein